MSRKREFIDFKKLSKKELNNLADKWEAEVRTFENILANAQRFSKVPADKLNRMWNTANSLWRRVIILEKWRNKTK